jgi:hypothetical protein
LLEISWLASFDSLKEEEKKSRKTKRKSERKEKTKKTWGIKQHQQIQHWAVRVAQHYSPYFAISLWKSES